jgi:hypothetical protein
MNLAIPVTERHASGSAAGFCGAFKLFVPDPQQSVIVAKK